MKILGGGVQQWPLSTVSLCVTASLAHCSTSPTVHLLRTLTFDSVSFSSTLTEEKNPPPHPLPLFPLPPPPIFYLVSSISHSSMEHAAFPHFTLFASTFPSSASFSSPFSKSKAL